MFRSIYLSLIGSLCFFFTSNVFAGDFVLAPSAGVKAVITGSGLTDIDGNLITEVVADNTEGKQDEPGAIMEFKAPDGSVLEVTQQVLDIWYQDKCHLVTMGSSWTKQPQSGDKCTFLDDSGASVEGGPAAIGVGTSSVAPQAPSDTSQVNAWDDKLNQDYTGVQVDVRKGTGYGLYVVKAWVNTELQPVVTGLFTFVPRPPPADYPELTKLWRWSEIDWEFVPHSASPAKEQIECLGSFPNASCTDYRSNGLLAQVPSQDPNYPGNYDYAWLKTEGAYTNDIMAQAIGMQPIAGIEESQRPAFKNWQELIDQTCDSENCIFKYGKEWPFPGALPLQSVDINADPNMIEGVAVNVFRMPAGTREITYTDPNTNRSYTGTFIPQEQVESDDPLGFAITNQSYLFNKEFNPYQGFHTYTFEVLADKIAFYIDAPDGGVGVKKVTPVAVFDISDFPGIGMMGPAMPGGTLTWKQKSGQQVLDKDGVFRLGDIQFMFNMWVNSMWGGMPGTMSGWDGGSAGDFKTTYTYLAEIGIYPEDGKGDYIINKTSPNVFYVNFNDWNKENWWPNFRKDFVAEHASDYTKSVLNVDWAKDPKGQLNTLRLALVKREDLPKKAVYQLSPGPNSIATVYQTGNESLVFSHARSPLTDVFKLDEDKLLTVSSYNITEDYTATCDIKLTAAGGGEIVRGDVSATNCSFYALVPDQGIPGLYSLGTGAPVVPDHDNGIGDGGAPLPEVGEVQYMLAPGNDVNARISGDYSVQADGGKPAVAFNVKPEANVILTATKIADGIQNRCSLLLTDVGYKKQPKAGDSCQFIADGPSLVLGVGGNIVTPSVSVPGEIGENHSGTSSSESTTGETAESSGSISSETESLPPAEIPESSQQPAQPQQQYYLSVGVGVDAELAGAVSLSVYGGSPAQGFEASSGDIIRVYATKSSNGVVNTCTIELVEGGFTLKPAGNDNCQFLGVGTGTTIAVGANIVVPQ